MERSLDVDEIKDIDLTTTPNIIRHVTVEVVKAPTATMGLEINEEGRMWAAGIVVRALQANPEFALASPAVRLDILQTVKGANGANIAVCKITYLCRKRSGGQVYPGEIHDVRITVPKENQYEVDLTGARRKAGQELSGIAEA